MMLQQQLLNNVALIAIVVVDCLLIMKDRFPLGLHNCCWETTLTNKNIENELRIQCIVLNYFM
jgi:hypothetical protein